MADVERAEGKEGEGRKTGKSLFEKNVRAMTDHDKKYGK